jgi:NitT/TauT family transport system substrate-binding protein
MTLRAGKRIIARFATAGVAVVAAATLAACGGTSDAGGGAGSGGTPVNIAVSLSTTSLPGYVAAQQGFFKKYGLDATLTKVDNKTNLVAGLGHNFDFGITYPPTVIAAIANGLPVQAVAGANLAGGSESADLDLLVPANSPITDVSQLSGKRIGAGTVNGVTHLMTLAWLKQVGVAPESTKAVALSLGTIGDQLKAGRIDVGELTEPYITQLKAQGFRSLGDPEDHVLNGTTTLSVWAADKNWAADHKDLVASFQKAQADAITWIDANRDAANKILSEQTGVPLATIQSAPKTDFRAALTTNDVQPFITMMGEVGWLKSPVEATSVVFAPPAS